MQLKRIGASCDWSKTAFTMDEDYSKAVTKVFVELYEDGMIYKGERIINWDPEGLTALSDEEVIHKEVNGHLWHFKYPIKDSDQCIIVATTRPETMLGDTGIAVNPKDDRYKDFVGKKVILPLVKREIPIFADSYVDKEFGTGAVKVTPAHDPNDFDMGQRNNLELINILNPDASLNGNVPELFRGMDRKEARKRVVEEMKSQGFLEKIEDYTHKVGHSERTDAIVEPYVSKQWFVDMEKLVGPAIDCVKNGEVKFYPERWTKTYYHWLDNIKDWCISRQLWWGHQIPVWYKNDEIYCGINPPEGDGWTQEEDVLDTWFSSWLWPFATLGWPEDTEDLAKHYPTQDLVTGPDIIFFWVARMIMAGLYFKKEIPFNSVYFNGLIRDGEGRKMSKSLGNSPDPIDLMDKYGSDALRVGLLLIAPQGLDILFEEEKIEHGRNFMNKLWNSARFVEMNMDENINSDLSKLSNDELDVTDKWILSKLNSTIIEVENAYDNYRMNDAVKSVYDFVYKNFCDWYIEFSKSRFYGTNEEDKVVAQKVCMHVLETILKLMHPYCPFITEEIWSHTNKNSMLINAHWPKSNKEMIDIKIENELSIIMNLISSIRNIKANFAISPKKEISLVCKVDDSMASVLKNYKSYLERLVKVTSLETGKNIEKPSQSTTIVTDNIEVYIPLKNLIDINKEIERLENQIQNLDGRLNSVNRKLDNKQFVSNAPEDIVTHEQNKKNRYKNELMILQDNLNSLK
jgi:valyl-tRNA synthetase